MSKKREGKAKYCNIIDYIDVVDKNFATAIRNYCLEGMLSPKRIWNGVTLLLPDKATRDAIMTTLSEDDAKGSRDFLNHVVPDIIADGADYMTKPLGTRNGIRLEVKAATRDKITLSNGSTIERDSAFATPHMRGGRIAVWNLDGPLPTDGGPYKPERRGPGAPPSAMGGARRRRHRGGASMVRAQLFNAMMGNCEAASRWDCAYQLATELIAFLRANAASDLSAVWPIIDVHPVTTLYLLLEPMRTASQPAPFLPDALIEQFAVGAYSGPALGGSQNAQNAPGSAGHYNPPNNAVVQAYFAAIKGAGGDLQKHLRSTAAIRAKILAIDIGSVLASTIIETYGSFIKTLPSETLAHLGGTEIEAANRKMWQDELRYKIFQVWANANCTANKLSEVFAMMPGNDFVGESVLSRIGQLNALSFDNTMAFVLAWVKSDAFLYRFFTPYTTGRGVSEEDMLNPDSDTYVPSTSIMVAATRD